LFSHHSKRTGTLVANCGVGKDELEAVRLIKAAFLEGGTEGGREGGRDGGGGGGQQEGDAGVTVTVFIDADIVEMIGEAMKCTYHFHY
jgi:hypothetical protein